MSAETVLTILARLQAVVVGNWITRANQIVDIVRDDPAAPHTLDTLASAANSAPHNFHRRFQEAIGETPVQFVRRSRVERAAYLMMATPDRTLTDIAHSTGFSDSSDFSRSFKRHYGSAPSAWSRNVERSVSSIAQASSDVRVISRAPMRLATVSVPGIFGLDDLRPGYESLCEWMAEVGVDLARSTLVGASFDNYRTTPRDRIRYTFGFVVPDGVEPSGPVVMRELPSFTAAAVSIDGPLSSIAVAWDHLYDDWFPARPWEPASMPALKLFRRRPDETGWDHFELDCAVAFRSGHDL